MLKHIILIVIVLGFGAILLATGDTKQKCITCEKPLIKGDYLAAVQQTGGIKHVHFRCALIKHLRTYSKD